MDILAQLMDAPNAALIIDEVQHRLDDEREKRMRFYNDIDESVKAEFINGEIILHSPVTRAHALAVIEIGAALHGYVKDNRLGEVHVEKSMIRLTRNDYEPDICFFSTEKAREFTPDQKLFPAPDLVVEVVSKSTEKVDRGIKFQDYAAHGVGEYWIVDTVEKAVEQYVLREGVFELVLRSHGTDIHADQVTGFVLQVKTLFND
ncbi:MAG: Uma2 family endonuclease [Saprospiraceae bacterium]|nr:Uma2 family endonuclease [Saprospiraceae bacterium]